MTFELLAEPFGVIESRIQQVINILSDRGKDNPNIAAAAREFRVPVRRLRVFLPGDIYNFDVTGFRIGVGKISGL